MRSLLKKPGAWIPIVIPLIFLAYMAVYLSLYGIVREADEGTPAHLFQLWLVLEPFMILFFALNWLPRHPKPALFIIALQLLSALLPISVVFLLKL